MTIESALSDIKNRLYLGLGAAGVLILLSGVLLLTGVTETVCLGALVLSVCFAALVIMKYGFCNETNIVILKGKCLEKKRSGYRKQYVEYTFKDENEHSFVIVLTHKEKFLKDITYEICCKKAAAEKERILGSDFLIFKNC